MMALNTQMTEMGCRAVRVYTLAMRFPRMVGKGFNGERLPGGPYTVPQFVGGGMTFGLSGISAYYLPIINPLVNLLIGAAITVVIGGALANVPMDGIKMTTRIGWVLGLLVSTAPSTTELMPAASPVAIVGGEVIMLDFARPRAPRRVDPTAPPAPLFSPDDPEAAAPKHLRRTPLFAPADRPAPLPATPAAAAAVFGALKKSAAGDVAS